jgi:hypothetical protein
VDGAEVFEGVVVAGVLVVDVGGAGFAADVADVAVAGEHGGADFGVPVGWEAVAPV